jgi:hypothetical protein
MSWHPDDRLFSGFGIIACPLPYPVSVQACVVASDVYTRACGFDTPGIAVAWATVDAYCTRGNHYYTLQIKASVYNPPSTGSGVQTRNFAVYRTPRRIHC